MALSKTLYLLLSTGLSTGSTQKTSQHDAIIVDWDVNILVYPGVKHSVSQPECFTPG